MITLSVSKPLSPAASLNPISAATSRHPGAVMPVQDGLIISRAAFMKLIDDLNGNAEAAAGIASGSFDGAQARCNSLGSCLRNMVLYAKRMEREALDATDYKTEAIQPGHMASTAFKFKIGHS